MLPITELQPEREEGQSVAPGETRRARAGLRGWPLQSRPGSPVHHCGHTAGEEQAGRDGMASEGGSRPWPAIRGQSTHHSSSTTRTSTKNVFLLTRFLNVSAKGENFSYVERGLKKQLFSHGGTWDMSGRAALASSHLLRATMCQGVRHCHRGQRPVKWVSTQTSDCP